MKTIQGTIFRIIDDLDLVSETLKALGKTMEATIPQVAVDEYYRLLLAAARLRESIEFLREVAGKTKNVTPTT